MTKKGLEIHEREQTCINKVDSYICMICGLDCKQKSNYDRHMNRKKKCEPIKKEENIEEKQEEEKQEEEKQEENIEKKEEKEWKKKYEELKKKYEETNIFLENQRQRFLKNEEENEKNKDEKYKKGIYHMVMNDYIDNEGIDYVIDKIINYDQTENIKNIKKYRNKIFKRLFERSNRSVPIFDVLGMGLIEGFEKEMNDIYICYNKIEEIFEIPQQIKILNNLSKKMPDNQQCIEIYNKLLEKTEDKQQKKEILKEIKKLQQ
jgi:hypothetical protein